MPVICISLSKKPGFRLNASVAALFAVSVVGLEATPARAADLSVSVELQGIERSGLRNELRGLADLAEADSTYPTFASVKRTGNRDVERILEALNSKGFYAAEVTPYYRRAADQVEVEFQIETGPKFTISRYVIQYEDEQPNPRPGTFADAGIETSGNPEGRRLRELETEFVTYLQENGYPVAKSLKHFVQANFNTGVANAVFRIESGAQAEFGDILVDGAEQTEPGFIKRYMTWEPGTLYTRQKVSTYREALVETGLFTEVSVSPAQPDGGLADIVVRVTERKRRTLGAGVSFATDVGAGARIFWENRNLFGRADTLSARLALSGPEQALQVSASRPYPALPGTLSATLTVANEISDAFEAQSVEVGLGLSKFWFDRKLETGIGVGLNYSQIEDAGVQSEFTYLKVPAVAIWNNSNDLLNPTSGFKISTSLTPFFGDVNFLQARISGQTRHAFGEDARFILAGRGAIGTSFGIDRDSIPATERFFAGGGGSVRGFAFQEAGPLDAELDPIGGASVLEVNLEGRVRVRDKIQIAAFVDAGTVSENDVPNFSEEAFVGAGLGVRYATPIGPLRVDVATPLNPRPTDDPIQFYIALGQPF